MYANTPPVFDSTHLCEAGAAAFDAVERLVDLVGPVDAEIELCERKREVRSQREQVVHIRVARENVKLIERKIK